MQLVQPLTSLVTPAVALAAARPVDITSGVDISTWKAPFGGAFSPVNFLVYIENDGAVDRTVGNATGGANGAEVWMGKKDRAGAFKWWLVGYLAGSAVVQVPASSGWSEAVETMTVGERLHICGAPSGGAPTWYAEPLEHILQSIQ